MLKGLFIVLGFVCVGLGSIGIILPGLPTTPLYLLAVYCFSKGSDRFYQWFTETRFYKSQLEDFAQTRTMTFRKKLCILLPVTVMLAIAGVTVPILPMRITLAALLAIKYYYFIFCIKTKK